MKYAYEFRTDISTSQRMQTIHAGGKKRASSGTAPKPAKKRARQENKTPAKRPRSAPKSDEDNTVKWNTLEHGGVLFPPEYQPHGIPVKYDGVPVHLTREQEEVATMYASMLESDYITKQKKTFLDNFWAEWKPMLGKKHTIQCLEKCDFRDIYNKLMEDRDLKKQMGKEVRL